VSGNQEVTYTVDFHAGRPDRRDIGIAASHPLPAAGERRGRSIPRIARLIERRQTAPQPVAVHSRPSYQSRIWCVNQKLAGTLRS
jgi:hypothetical protein